MVWAFSLAARRGQLLPRSATWGGLIVAVVCLATTALDGAALILLLVWIVSISLLLREAASSRPGSAR
jgi:hypothetical protein